MVLLQVSGLVGEMVYKSVHVFIHQSIHFQSPLLLPLELWRLLESIPAVKEWRLGCPHWLYIKMDGESSLKMVGVPNTCILLFDQQVPP